MKKSVFKLIVTSLCAAALSGCSLLGFGDDNNEALGLDLRDYKTAAVKDSKYEYSGKVFLRFEDKAEVEVTEKCTYSTLDTSKLGKQPFKVSFEASAVIFSKTVYINVVESLSLKDLVVEGYTEKVKAGESYTFDGKVYAVYDDNSRKDVTSSAVFSSVDTSSSGKKEITVSYTEAKVTKKATFSIDVFAELVGISVSGYSSNFNPGSDYIFNGKVVAKYSDNSTVDVTEKAEIDASKVDTSKEDSYEVVVSYTEGDLTVKQTITIKVSEKIKELVKIEASGYTKTVNKLAKYVFDGVVTATYDNGTTADVTNDNNCVIPELNTQTSGTKTLTISYSETTDGKTITKQYKISDIEVIARVTGLVVPDTLTVTLGKSKTLSCTVQPSDAKNKNVSFSSSNTNVATVDKNGLVTGVSNGTATITVTAEDNGVSASSVITVSDEAKAEWTILLYMCGADLESKYQLATSDLKEILTVAGQPDDVNIVIQTGGAKSWSSSYSISSSKIGRYHVSNKSLVRDAQLTYASMGLTSTLQSFLKYGLTEYPAEKTGVIFWNHGGGMTGVCFDEKSSDDSLLNTEIQTAVKEALKETGHEGEKLEFVGYDACLMQVQDIAIGNAPYFNYMIASEESEAGEGWDYDTWIDDLYAKKTTPEILKACVDGFILDNGGTSSSSNDQTLSYLDLSKAEEYKAAWEDMALALKSKITSSNKSSFKTLVKSAKRYAVDGYSSDLYYGLVDAKDFVNKLAANSTFKPDASYTNAVLTAHSNFVKYSSKGRGAGNSYGLCMYWGLDSDAKSYYSSTYTTLSNWLYLVNNFGY